MWGRTATRGRRRQPTSPVAYSASSVESLEPRTLLSALTVQVPATRDTTIYDVVNGDQANGAGEFIVVGGSTGSAAARRGLIAFELSGLQIPDGSTVLDVVLTMHLSQSIGGPAGIGLHRVVSPWLEAGSNAIGNEIEGNQAHQFDATWKYALFDGLEWNTPGGDFEGVSATTTVSSLGSYEWAGGSLVADVQQWIDGPSSNFGWMIKGPETAGDIKAFTSRHSDNVALRPVLEISYEEPILPPIVAGRQFHDVNGDGLRMSPTVASLNLQYSAGRNFFNVYGGSEYWYRAAADNAWHFLTPDGNLTRWDGTPTKLTGTVVEKLDARTWHNPNALLGSPSVTPEPWANGLTFELVNAVGNVVATTTSRDFDVNNDGTIQEETERGWYRFGSVSPGNYTVRQQPASNWIQSASTTSPLAGEAYALDTSLNLTFTGNLYQNFGGRGEKWLKGSSLWYYITPNGDFYRWNGRPVTSSNPLGGTFIASFGISYFRDVSLLYAAENPVQSVQTGTVINTVNFGSYQPAEINGFTWNDVNPDGKRNPPEFPTYRAVNAPSGAPAQFQNNPWFLVLLPEGGHPLPPNPIYRETYFYTTDLGEVFQWSSPGGSVLHTVISGKSGFTSSAVAAQAFANEPLASGYTVQLLDEFGNVVASTISADRDLNNNGTIEAVDERGWYEFASLIPGKYSVRQLQQAGTIQASHGAPSFQATAAALRQQLGFKAAAHDHYNFGGRNERWFQNSSNAWYYITPEGTVFQWNRNSGGNLGLVRGTQIAQLSSSFYLNLNLLFQPKSTALTVNSDQTVSLDLGSCRIVDSLFASLAGQLS